MWSQTITFIEVPELAEAIEKYGVFEGPLPPYVLIGTVEFPNSKYGRTGVMAFANNEFHANLLKKIFNKYGHVGIEKTKSHPDGETFSLDFIQKFDMMFGSPNTR